MRHFAGQTPSGAGQRAAQHCLQALQPGQHERNVQKPATSSALLCWAVHERLDEPCAAVAQARLRRTVEGFVESFVE